MRTSGEEAVWTVLARLASASRGDGSALFSSGQLNERLPPLFDYYLGYLVAAEAGKTRSPRQLGALTSEQARSAVDAGLRSLANCPS